MYIDCLFPYIYPENQFVFKLVCKDWYTAFKGVKTKTHVSDYCGSISGIQWLLSIGYQWDSALYEYAISKKNNHDVVLWLYNQGCPIHKKICDTCIIHGNIDLLKWFYSKNYKLSIASSNLAVLNQRLDILKWLYDKSFPIVAFAMLQACTNADLPMIQWLCSIGYSIDNDCIVKLFSNTSAQTIQICDWLNTQGYQFKPVHGEICAKVGNVQCLKYLENLTDFEPFCLVQAAMCQDTEKAKEMIVWLLHKGIKRHPRTCVAACLCGDLPLFKYLTQLHFPYKREAFEAAVSSGNLSLVKYMFENGYTYNRLDLLVRAHKTRDLDMMRYITDYL